MEQAETAINGLRSQVRDHASAPVEFVLVAKGDESQCTSDDASPNHQHPGRLQYPQVFLQDEVEEDSGYALQHLVEQYFVKHKALISRWV